MSRVFVYIAHRAGVPEDAAAELAGAAAQAAPGSKPVAVVSGWGPELDGACETVRLFYPEVWKLAAEPLAYPNAELVRQALARVLPQGSMVLGAHSHFGVDLLPGLSVKLFGAYVPDVVAVEAAGPASLDLVRQEFAGQVSVRVRCDTSKGAVLSIRPGAFKPLAGSALSGSVVDQSAQIGPLAAGRRYVETIQAETGDIDISRESVLVSIGRGIQDPENIPIAEDLAAALGGAVSCSRPVVDAKWLDKSRQVGSSGRTVKPKIYLACGISGSFQHMAGVKGGPLIVAINKNPKAPIFRVAQVGVVDDLLEFLPALAQAIRARKPAGMARSAS